MATYYYCFDTVTCTLENVASRCSRWTQKIPHYRLRNTRTKISNPEPRVRTHHHFDRRKKTSSFVVHCLILLNLVWWTRERRCSPADLVSQTNCLRIQVESRIRSLHVVDPIWEVETAMSIFVQLWLSSCEALRSRRFRAPRTWAIILANNEIA